MLSGQECNKKVECNHNSREEIMAGEMAGDLYRKNYKIRNINENIAVNIR